MGKWSVEIFAFVACDIVVFAIIGSLIYYVYRTNKRRRLAIGLTINFREKNQFVQTCPEEEGNVEMDQVIQMFENTPDDFAVEYAVDIPLSRRKGLDHYSFPFDTTSSGTDNPGSNTSKADAEVDPNDAISRRRINSSSNSNGGGEGDNADENAAGCVITFDNSECVQEASGGQRSTAAHHRIRTTSSTNYPLSVSLSRTSNAWYSIA